MRDDNLKIFRAVKLRSVSFERAPKGEQAAFGVRAATGDSPLNCTPNEWPLVKIHRLAATQQVGFEFWSEIVKISIFPE